ncbi:MAG: biopolymer transporter ExbD [Akkermansia sp.]|nr:biopolymer transporter ExbD [Akkermansia sp.]MBQ9830372.1 biopolymer transporter ExbD [Akkermansia sp.]
MKLYERQFAQQGIPIVPMLDILTILLIFFIVHTEFKRQVSVLQLDVPQTHHLAGTQGDRNSILLEVADDGTIAFNGKLVPAEQLVAAVRELMKQNPQARIQVSAAGGSSMARFVEVLDTLTAAGINVEQVPVRIDYQP